MSSEPENEGKRIKVTVKDKRGRSADGVSGHAAREGADRSSGGPSPSRASGSGDPKDRGIPAEASSEGTPAAASVPGEAMEVDYLGELQRERAEFENYRKRMMREVAATSGRAKASLAEKLLPVLDNFERAISHGEGGEGVALVYRELKTALEGEGLEEVPALGEVFDPNVHEAVMLVEDPAVDQQMVKEVHRRGYRFGEQLLRAASVVVATPSDADASAEAAKE